MLARILLSLGLAASLLLAVVSLPDSAAGRTLHPNELWAITGGR